MQPETRLVNRIREAILAAHPEAWILKVHGGPTQTAGVPDLLVCVRGQLIGLEVKCPRPGETPDRARGRASRLQLAQLDKLRRAGAGAAVVLTPEEALQSIDLHLTYRGSTVGTQAQHSREGAGDEHGAHEPASGPDQEAAGGGGGDRHG